jgi:hypothetical protein
MSFASSSSLRANALRTLAAIGLLGTTAGLFGCPAGKCWVRFQTYSNGRQTSDQCLVDSCPENSAFNDASQACTCKENFVTFNGACIALDEANKQCGAGNQYANGGCVAIACPKGQILNAASGRCESRATSDALVAKAEGKELKANQTIGCPTGFTYIFNGAEGACVPNDAVCGVGTRFDNGKCVALSCPAGQVFDLAANNCAKLSTGQDEKTFSVALKLKAALGPDFCSPHAKNPGGFGVYAGQTKTVRVTVTVNVPDNKIESAQVSSLTTTDANGQPLPANLTGLAAIKKQVDEQVLAGIKALGGKSIEPTATASIDCKITRAAVQVIETQGGGV